MFGSIDWCDTYVGNTARINIGDNFQFLALEYIYQTLGLESSLKKISLKDLRTYKGECLVVPLNWGLFDANWMENDNIAISCDIKPLFLSVTLGSHRNDQYFNSHNIEYLRSNGPIGCRDEVTFRKLQEYNIPCYLNGCLTLTTPSSVSSGKFVYFIDVPLSLADKIPDTLLSNARFVSHQVYYSKDADPKTIVQNIKKQYDEYRKNAKLIVTSRLHAVAPCIGMGIPVIFTKEIIDDRFSWLDKIVPLYSLSDWNSINWHPTPIDADFIKSKMLKCAQERILGRDSSKLQNEITNFWLERPKRSYENFRTLLYENFDPIFQWLDASWQRDNNQIYSIWGVTIGADKLIRLIHEKYPSAKLCKIIDTYRTEKFHEFNITKPSDLVLADNEKLIVLANGASPQARDFIQSRRINPFDCFLLSDNFITSKEDLLRQRTYVQRQGRGYTDING